MTWGDLEQLIDASNLTLRTYAVLKAFSRHVNPPDEKRAYPDNMIVWPSMEALMDLSRSSQTMVQRAKHALVVNGILELAAPAGRGRTPRYRINEQKIQRDEAALERQQQRRQRRQKGHTDAEKGRIGATLSDQKGGSDATLFGLKGRTIDPPEVSPEVKSPVVHNSSIATETNNDTDGGTLTSHNQTPTLTTSMLLTEELRAWATVEVPSVNLAWQAKKFLLKARMKARTEGRNPDDLGDLSDDFRYWLMIAVEVQATHGITLPPSTPAPTAEPRCSWNGCDEPRCGHGLQACRRHGWGTCDDCLAEDTP